MKSIPIVGWVFFGLVVIVLVFYMLSRGIYIDSTKGFISIQQWNILATKAAQSQITCELATIYSSMAFNTIRRSW
jgi:hypothetical protein